MAADGMQFSWWWSGGIISVHLEIIWIRSDYMFRCIYCLKEFPDADRTIDHVIARSWYPANTPSIEKWKAPACEPCNNRLGSFEDNALTILAHCLNPKDPAVSHIVEKARRSIDPEKSNSPSDFEHRLKRKRAFIRQIITVHDSHGRGILPSFRDNFEQGSRTGILIPGVLLARIIHEHHVI